jgi:hypothetical protein
MAVALLLAPAGCSLGGDEEPKPATGPAQQVAVVIEQLERATREGDYADVCEDVLTEAARERAGGEECERLLRSAAEGLERPSIEIVRIDVNGGRASVRVRTKASGQALVSDTLALRGEGGEWRVEALSD